MPSADYGGYNLGADVQLRGAAHAFEGKVFHVVVSSVIDATVVDKLSETEEKRRILTSPQSSFTGIFAPGGNLMSDTVSPDREEIVYAVCDIEAIIGPKLRHDVAGQHNRFDVLSLKLNRAPCVPIIETGNVLRSKHLHILGPQQGNKTADLEPTTAENNLDYNEVTKGLIREAMKITRGNVSEAARLMNMPSHKLRYRIKKYGLLCQQLN